jgi:hypothetical protein
MIVGPPLGSSFLPEEEPEQGGFALVGEPEITSIGSAHSPIVADIGHDPFERIGEWIDDDGRVLAAVADLASAPQQAGAPRIVKNVVRVIRSRNGGALAKDEDVTMHKLINSRC